MSETQINIPQSKAGWGVKEIINVVLFSALTLVVTFVAAALTIFNDTFATFFSGPAGTLIAAPIYVLMVRRVNKFGVTTVLGAIFGIFVAFASNQGILGFLWFVIWALLIDAIFLRTPEARSKRLNIIGAWGVWSLIYVFSTTIPILRDSEGYLETMRQSASYSNEYIATFTQFWYNPMWVALILLVSVLMGLLGAWFGTKMAKKHFEKAGVL